MKIGGLFCRSRARLRNGVAGAAVALLPGFAAVAAPASAETCVTAQVVEICMQPEEVARTVDADALRRLFSPDFREAQKSKFLRHRQAAAHPQATALRRRWNQVAASVLAMPEGRASFYRGVFERSESMGLANITLDLPIMFRISGLPREPQASVGPGFIDLMRSVGGPELAQADPRMVAEKMNAMFSTPDGAGFASSFNLLPLVAEFIYQLRQIYRELDKDVVVFDAPAGAGAPAVDSAGTLYVPRSFFELYDALDQDLVLIHEATHLKHPPSALLMQLVMNRLGNLGPMGAVLGNPEVRKAVRRMSPDVEPEIDTAVLLYLRFRPDLRRRYGALLERSATQRARIVAYLNEQMDQGAWPRPPVRLGLSALAPMLAAQAQYESLPDGPEKVAAGVRVMELAVTGLPPQEQSFYRPLLELTLKYQLEVPARFIAGMGQRPPPSDQELLEEGVVVVLEEVMRRWRRQ